MTSRYIQLIGGPLHDRSADLFSEHPERQDMPPRVWVVRCAGCSGLHACDFEHHAGELYHYDRHDAKVAIYVFVEPVALAGPIERDKVHA